MHFYCAVHRAGRHAGTVGHGLQDLPSTALGVTCKPARLRVAVRKISAFTSLFLYGTSRRQPQVGLASQVSLMQSRVSCPGQHSPIPLPVARRMVWQTAGHGLRDCIGSGAVSEATSQASQANAARFACFLDRTAERGVGCHVPLDHNEPSGKRT